MAAMGAGSVTVVAKTSISFLTFGSSVEISPSNSGGAGHAFSGCHRNSGPVNQRCCSVSVLRSKPRDASFLCVHLSGWNYYVSAGCSCNENLKSFLIIFYVFQNSSGVGVILFDVRLLLLRHFNRADGDSGCC